MQRAVWAAVLVAIGGCGGSHPPPAKEPAAACSPSTPTLSIAASDRVNSSSAGQGRPVQVRVYQLKSDSRLSTAKFEDIWQNDTATLQADLVKVEEVTVYPGETKQVKIVPNPDAHTLAAVALFREPQGKSWFQTYELASPRKDPPCPPSDPKISVWLDRMQIEDGQGNSGDNSGRGN
jgi:type VI secretion system protein VasD